MASLTSSSSLVLVKQPLLPRNVAAGISVASAPSTHHCTAIHSLAIKGMMLDDVDEWWHSLCTTFRSVCPPNNTRNQTANSVL